LLSTSSIFATIFLPSSSLPTLIVRAFLILFS